MKGYSRLFRDISTSPIDITQMRMFETTKPVAHDIPLNAQTYGFMKPDRGARILKSDGEIDSYSKLKNRHNVNFKEMTRIKGTTNRP
jgi:hypothetical protein